MPKYVKKYVKKSAVVKARQTNEPLEVATPDGNVKASPKDWVVTNERGEQSVCTPKVFHDTYEAHGD